MQHRALFFFGLLATTSVTVGVACKKSDSTESSSGSSGTGDVDYTDAAVDAKFTSGDDSSTVAPPPSTASSCDLTKDQGYCIDFGPDQSGEKATDECESAYQSGLTDGGIASESNACPTANRVGTCVETLGGTQTTQRYYSPRWTTETAQGDCGSGQFTPN